MEDSDSLSNHTFQEEQEEEEESKCINFLKCFLSVECGNILSLINAILSVSCVMLYIYTDYQPKFVLINSNSFFIVNFVCRCFFALYLIFEILLGKYDFTFKNMSTLIFCHSY